jgi:hypothetical protein
LTISRPGKLGVLLNPAGFEPRIPPVCNSSLPTYNMRTWRRAFRCASNAQNSLAAGSCACRAPPAPQHCRDAPRHVLVVGAGGRARRRPRRQRRGRPDLRVRSLCGKAAAQRRRPIRPPARPASVRLSPGQPPASTSLGSNRQLRAGDTGPVSNIGTQRKANPSRAACGSC